MLLEDYFDKQAVNDIRIKGTRIGIETVLFEFLHYHRASEQIVQAYPPLTLEQVYARKIRAEHDTILLKNF